ncbi:Arylsulfatase [Pontiella desulfatans]|uniref:Arylsulfatase n=1 Tax=Pontiella desulfatans TaxID=2750659 RepID=A0A6C2U149_PONDE|nr:arylsulfatase [Pontiella desulfatans]SPS73853.1 sulfatase S1_4 [Kiritimatiellales bacterium]VGO13617.1 Arylsulfatase [Pontiella desulfatans]
MNIRTLIGSLVATTTLVVSATEKPLQGQDRPNIILIMADDMGFSDIGCYGGEIETPNLDALAANGLRFKQFYNSARCCPTRATLMTGLHPHEAGIGHMTKPPGVRKDELEHAYQGYLNRKCVTLAEVLKPAGYATLMTGKWHLGMAEESQWPLQRGFEKFYGCLAGATRFFTPSHPRGITLGNDPIEKPESTTDRRYYTTDAFTDYAIQFIDEEQKGKDRPFFLYLAYTAPHWPLHAHQEEVKKYAGKYMLGWDKLRDQRLVKQVEMGLIDPSWQLCERSNESWDSLDEQTKKEMDLRMAYYAAMIDRMDQNIGKLVDHLKQNGQLDNTLILFLSDNGGCAESKGNINPFDTPKWEEGYGSRAGYGPGWANASNTPFRKFKHYTHEGGIASPFVAHWPKGIQQKGGWVAEPASLPDLMPTFLDLAGANYPQAYKGNPIRPLSGLSLDPLFKGKPLGRIQPLYFEHENNAAIIQGDWKLVGTGVSAPGGPEPKLWELYNLKDDRTELNDLKEKYPEKTAELSKLWKSWADQNGVYPKPVKGKKKKK